MAARDSSVDDLIPDLTEDQHQVFREFIRRHRCDTGWRICSNPILLARVLAGDKPTAYIDLNGEKTYPNINDADRHLHSLCNRLGLHRKKVKGGKGWVVGHSSWRLDLLPTQVQDSDSYHRRCGFVYGYPTDAIEDFINTKINVTRYNLVRGGIFEPEEVSYISFVPYTYHNSLERYEQLIEEGKEIRQRIGELAMEWDLPELDHYAQALYNGEVQDYSGKGTWVPTMFSVDQNVTRGDVESLLH